MIHFISNPTCKLVKGSIFCTGPLVRQGNEVVTAWFGKICVTLTPSAGIKPNLNFF